MSLDAQVTSRVPTVTLAQLTQSTPGATTVDTAVLALAVADTEADLMIYAGVTYDETRSDIALLISAAIPGVLLHLLTNKGESKAAERLAAWQQGLNKGLRLVTGNNRILPTSRSPLRPTPETATEPYFGIEQENRWIPGANRGGNWPPSSEPGP